MATDAGGGAIEALRARGRVPVFPLPDVVLFPHAVLPLHIFEPRYRRMTEDALRTDRLIAMALLRPGWEQGYLGNPPVHPIACAGTIEDEQPLPDGRFNIRLRGLARIAILGFEQDTPYRVAAVRVLEDQGGGPGPEGDDDRRRLLAACASLLQETSGQPGNPVVLDGSVPLSVVVNTLCQSLAMEAEEKQRLLALDDVRERCRALGAILDARWRRLALLRAGDPPPAGSIH